MIALLFVVSVAPAMAADLQAFPKMTDQELSSVRGGYSSNRIIVNIPGISFDKTETQAGNDIFQYFQGDITKTNGTFTGKYRSSGTGGVWFSF
jgi:hypothetical protein